MNEKILVVDDEKEICDLLTEYLQEKGYGVTAVSSGQDAISEMKDHVYDLHIIDIGLEGPTTGIDVIAHAVRLPRKPKILIISGTSKYVLGPLVDKEGVGMWVDQVLEKPRDLTPDRFLSVVEKVLASSENPA